MHQFELSLFRKSDSVFNSRKISAIYLSQENLPTNYQFHCTFLRLNLISATTAIESDELHFVQPPHFHSNSKAG